MKHYEAPAIVDVDEDAEFAVAPLYNSPSCPKPG